MQPERKPGHNAEVAATTSVLSFQSASVKGLCNLVHLPLHYRGRVLSLKSPNCCRVPRDEEFPAGAPDEVLLVGDAQGHALFLMSLGPKDL
jgi:hypothetical protein